MQNVEELATPTYIGPSPVGRPVRAYNHSGASTAAAIGRAHGPARNLITKHYVRFRVSRLRKGGLNIAATGLWLFVRDICGGDFIAWINARLAAADPGVGTPDRTAGMPAALIEPLCAIPFTGPKLWNLILAEFFLVADPDRERWVATGASMIAVDTLVHAYLHRTGILRRLQAEHRYGPACYAPDGCAAIIQALADRIDAREFNPTFPRTFPRLIQHALWLLCSAAGRDICNGTKINDHARCAQMTCPSFPICDRVTLGS